MTRGLKVRTASPPLQMALRRVISKKIGNFCCNLEGLHTDVVPNEYQVSKCSVPPQGVDPDIEVAIWNNNYVFEERYFKLLPNLRLLINCGSNDFNLPDSSAFRARSVTVKKVDSYSTQAVAEYIVAMFMVFERQLALVPDRVRMNAENIGHKRIGVIGLGKIGYTVAHILQDGFGAEVMYSATEDKKIESMKFATNKQILSTCDYVVIAAKSKKFSLQESDFAKVNPQLIIVNVSGSEIVPRSVIAPLIQKKRIRGYVTDYFGEDDVHEGEHSLNTPHIAYKTGPSQRNKMQQLSFHLKKYFKKNSVATKCYILRHGTSVWNVEGILQGRLDSPLTPTGIAEAQAMGKFLRGKVDVILSSPLGRARQTADIIAEITGKRIEVITEFAEMDFGFFQGKSKDDIRRVFADFFEWKKHSKLYTKYPGGESYFDVYLRVISQTAHVAARYNNFAIVAHESTNRMIRAVLAEKPLSLAVNDQQKNHEIVEYDMSSDSETLHVLE